MCVCVCMCVMHNPPKPTCGSALMVAEMTTLSIFEVTCLHTLSTPTLMWCESSECILNITNQSTTPTPSPPSTLWGKVGGWVSGCLGIFVLVIFSIPPFVVVTITLTTTTTTTTTATLSHRAQSCLLVCRSTFNLSWRSCMEACSVSELWCG